MTTSKGRIAVREGNPTRREQAVLTTVLRSLAAGDGTSRSGQRRDETSREDDEANRSESRNGGSDERACPLCGESYDYELPSDEDVRIKSYNRWTVDVCLHAETERLLVHRKYDWDR